MNAIQTAMLKVALERMNESEYEIAEKMIGDADAGEIGAEESLIEMVQDVLNRVT